MDKKKHFIQKAIKHKGKLTEEVGGKPSQNLSKVVEMSKNGNAADKARANFYLNVLRPAAQKRKKK